MRLGILLWLVILNFPAQASVHGIQKHTFECSSGAKYDVGIYFMSGGYSPGAAWQFVVFCRAGTLKKNFYGWMMHSREVGEDYRACMDDEFPDTLTCQKEFESLNPVKGPDIHTFKMKNSTVRTAPPGEAPPTPPANR